MATLWDNIQETYFNLKVKMGDVFSSNHRRQMQQAQLMQQQRMTNMSCDDCGQIISVTSDFDQEIKRCERCAARVIEEKIARSPYARQCSVCQMLFTVSERVTDIPLERAINCQRCSDTRRRLIQNGAYVELALQKGGERFYICCPKVLMGEMRKCMQNQYKEQNTSYAMLPN